VKVVFAGGVGEAGGCCPTTGRHAQSEVESLKTRTASEIRFNGLVEIFAQPRTEFGACTKKYTFYRRHREIEDLGDLFVTELVITAQHKRHSLGLRKPLNRPLDRLL